MAVGKLKGWADEGCEDYAARLVTRPAYVTAKGIDAALGAALGAGG